MKACLAVVKLKLCKGTKLHAEFICSCFGLSCLTRVNSQGGEQKKEQLYIIHVETDPDGDKIGGTDAIQQLNNDIYTFLLSVSLRQITEGHYQLLLK